MHPRWLSDNNDGNELWPDNLPKQSSQDEMELVQDEVVIEEVEQTGLTWTDDHEHDNVSNCGDIIFGQDIPTSLEEEVVTNSGTEDTECDNISDYNGSQSTQTMEFESDSPKRFADAYVPMSSRLSPTALAKVDKRHRPLAKFKQTLMVSRDILKLNQRKFNVDLSAGTSLLKPMIREHVNDVKRINAHRTNDESDPDFINSILQSTEVVKVRHSKKSKTHSKKHGRHHGDRSGSGKTKNARIALVDGKGSHKFVDLHGENITINHEADESRPADRVIDKHGANVTIHHEATSDAKPIDAPEVLEQTVKMVRQSFFLEYYQNQVNFVRNIRNFTNFHRILLIPNSDQSRRKPRIGC